MLEFTVWVSGESWGNHFPLPALPAYGIEGWRGHWSWLCFPLLPKIRISVVGMEMRRHIVVDGMALDRRPELVAALYEWGESRERQEHPRVTQGFSWVIYTKHLIASVWLPWDTHWMDRKSHRFHPRPWKTHGPSDRSWRSHANYSK